MLMQRLGNPDVIDVQVDLKKTGARRSAAVKEALAAKEAAADKAVVDKAVADKAVCDEEGDKRRTTSAAFRAALHEAEATSPERAPQKSERGEEADASHAEDKREDKRKRDREESSSQRRQDDSDSERLEKQGYLIELQNLEKGGVKLSRSFNMTDSVAEMEFELNRHLSAESTQNAVSFMRDTLRIAVTGLEAGNARFGPFLSIDGWADSITRDMKRYDHSLERIYKRYWRKQQMSPVMELAWLILGSMISWHFTSKVFGAARSPPHAQNAPRAPSPPASSNAARRPEQANVRKPSRATPLPMRPRAARPTLKAPGASLLELFTP